MNEGPNLITAAPQLFVPDLAVASAFYLDLPGWAGYLAALFPGQLRSTKPITNVVPLTFKDQPGASIMRINKHRGKVATRAVEVHA